MKFVKRLLVILVAIIALFFIIGLFLPSKYQVERSIVINAPAETIFEQVNDLKKAEKWNAWSASDPTMKITYGEVTVGVGATSSWTSEKSGNGTQKIIESIPPKSTKTHLDFGKMGTATGYFTFEEAEGGIKATNGFYGDNGMKIISRYFGLMMDGMVGPFFEKGLAQLKTIAEKEAKLEAERKAKEAEADSTGSEETIESAQ